MAATSFVPTDIPACLSGAGIFGYAPLHGHWHPEVQGYPIRLNCSVGNCTTSEDVVFNHIKDYTRMLEDYVMKLRPTPTYLVLNTAIWRLLDERHFKLLIKQVGGYVIFVLDYAEFFAKILRMCSVPF